MEEYWRDTVLIGRSIQDEVPDFSAVYIAGRSHVNTAARPNGLGAGARMPRLMVSKRF